MRRRRKSGRGLALLAQGEGYRVTPTTINHISAGTYKHAPKDETLRAIAWLAGVDDRVVFEAAGRDAPGPPFADELPPGVDDLSPRMRRIATDFLRVLVQLNEGREA